MRRVLLMVVNDPKYFLSHRLPIAKAAKEAGYDVHIASIKSPLSKRIIELGFGYHHLFLTRGSVNPLREFYALVGLTILLWRLRPSVLHLVTAKPIIYGGIAARFSPVGGVVSAIAGLGSIYIGSDARSKLLTFLISAMYRFALKTKNTHVIFQNSCDRELIIKATGISPQATVLINGSGVLLESYPITAEPPGKVTVTFAGRFIKDKGIYEFVEAARFLKIKLPDVIFQLVGDIDEGNPSSLTRAEVSEISDEGSVRVLGYRSDMADIFSLSHIIVLPSYREGLPKVLIEAAACARAVITTDVPGCRDAIISGQTGLLVPVKNSYALASAIEKLVLDEELRLSMGRTGRRLAECEFAIEKVVGMHMDIYKKIVSQSES
ncbi:glycosyltransferase family 4 protein [Pseudomonas sp. D2-30]|uniref:glycosyltransferase family 4 protein n=1 Tax=unclassified Pseudomonas TaxID=196821 RepID=UPI003DA9ACD8